MNKLILALSLVAALAGPAAAEVAMPREVIVASFPLARLSDDSLIGRRWDDVGELTEAEQNCQKQVDAALAGGMKLNDEFELERIGPIEKLPHTRANPGEPKYWSNLALMRAFCKERLAKVQLLRTYLTVGEAQSDLMGLLHGSDPSPTKIKYVAGKQRACAREVKRALDMKNPPTTQFERPDITLGEAQDKVCGALATALGAARDKLKKQQDLSKFAKLPGDRKKVFEEQALFAEDVFGEGKTPLEAADDFKYSGTWYVVLADRSDFGGPAWLVRTYRFDGDKLAETKEQRFDGEAPPKDIFK